MFQDLTGLVSNVWKLIKQFPLAAEVPRTWWQQRSQANKQMSRLMGVANSHSLHCQELLKQEEALSSLTLCDKHQRSQEARTVLQDLAGQGKVTIILHFDPKKVTNFLCGQRKFVGLALAQDRLQFDNVLCSDAAIAFQTSSDQERLEDRAKRMYVER